MRLDTLAKESSPLSCPAAAAKVMNAGFHNGIRSFADAVAHAASVFGEDKIHALRPYLRGGWEELRRREGDAIEDPDYATVLNAYLPTNDPTDQNSQP